MYAGVQLGGGSFRLQHFYLGNPDFLSALSMIKVHGNVHALKAGKSVQEDPLPLPSPSLRID